MRAIGRFLGAIAVFAPAVAILIWGASYLLSAWNALQGSNTVISATVKAGDDLLDIRVQRFQVDLWARTAVIGRVDILEQNGNLIAASNFIRASQDASTQAVRVNIAKVWATLERDKKGDLSIARFLRQQDTVQKPMPLDINIGRLDLRYKEASGKYPWTQAVRADNTQILMFGDLVSGTAIINAPGLANGFTRFQASEEIGLILKGKGKLALNSFIEKLRNTREGQGIRELRGLRVAQGNADGPFEIQTDLKGGVRIVADAVGSARGIVYEGYALDQAIFAGRVTDSSFLGKLNGSLGPSTGALDGRLEWGGKQLVQCKFIAQTLSGQSLPLWIRRSLPKELAFQNGRAQGWVSWNGKEAVATGDTSFSRLAVLDQILDRPAGHFVVVGDQAGIDLKSGSWQTTPVKGQLIVKNGQLAGVLKTGNVDLKRIGRQYGVSGILGRAEISALLGGSIQKPTVAWQAKGRASSDVPGYAVDLGMFAAGGGISGDTVRVDRLSFNGKNGTGVGTGQVNTKTQKYTFDVRGQGIPVSTFTSEATGTANFGGTISGTRGAYMAKGLLEVFNATTESGATLAYGSAQITGTPRLFRADDLIAFDDRGARVQGWLALQPGTNALSGIIRANGIDLESYTESGVSGTARFTDGLVSGTLTAPVFSAEVNASNIVVGPIRFPRISANALLNGSKVDLTNLVADAAPGSITGSAQLDLNQKGGTFQVKVADLDIESLLAQVAEAATVEGKVVDGEFTGQFAEGKIFEAIGYLQVDGFKLNDSLVGSGRIDAAKKDGLWTADAAIGYDSQYVELALKRYEEETGEIDGQVTAGDVALQQLYAAFKRYTIPQNGKSAQVELTPQTQDILPYLRGSVSAQANVSGTTHKPNVELETFDITEFFVSDNILGEQTTPVPAGTLHAQGNLSPEGLFQLVGSVRGLQPRWLSRLNPTIADLDGILTVDAFEISGSRKETNATVSLGYAEYETTGLETVSTLGGPQDPTKKLTRSVDIVAKLLNQQWMIDGGYQAEGFTGGIEALIPFTKDFQIPDDQPISAKMAIGPVNAADPAQHGRTLSDLAEFFPSLDLTRSNGVLTGFLSVAGLKDDLQFNGLVTLLPEPGKSSPVIAMKGDPNLLENINLALSLSNTGLVLKGGATSANGGTVAINDLTYSPGNLQEAVTGGLDAMLNKSVSGSIDFNALRLRYIDKESGPIEAILNGNLAIEAMLAAPRISGDLKLTDAILSIPTLPQTTTAIAEPLINPSFDITIASANPMRFRAGTGDFRISGMSKITGDLLSPKADALMVVDQGTIRLPTSRITIDEGGTITVTYRGDGTARADLLMTGRTQITAASPSGGANRYDINLDITGNILEEGGLQLRASSDPPDLNEGQILALLGQRQLVEGFTINEDPAKQIQAALFQVAVPYLATTLTSQLANSLGLDYLSIDYDPFDQLTLSAAVQLGRHLTLSARRQLSQPVVGIAQKYDVRLSYRPPFGGRTFRRVSFNIGFDQDRPWRIGVEYGIRF